MDIYFKFAVFQCLFLQVTAVDPIILWTQKSHAWSKIRGVTGNPDTWLQQKYKPYVQSESIKNTFKFGLTYNPATNELFWSDISRHNILKQDLNSSLSKRMDNVKEVFKKDGAEISSLAVDWLAGNLYFVERNDKYIAVKSLKNSNNLYKILFKSTVTNPTSLAVDPYKGLLFWSDQSKGTIESSTTFGTNQKTIVSGLQKPSGITLDITEQRIYYIDTDAGSINSIKYDGTGRTQLYMSPKKRSYFEITLLQNYIFITTGDGLQVDIHKKSGEYISSTDIDASAFHIIGLKNYQMPPHECESKNCEQICLNVGEGNKGQCTCVTGYTIHTDGMTCKESSSPSYVLIKDKSVILSEAVIDDSGQTQVSLSNKIIREGATEARAVGVHYYKSYVYYSDISTDVIYHSNTKGTVWREITVNTRHVEGITVDWIANNLYWSDKALQHIMCSHLTGHYHRIHVQHLVQPKDLTIDPINKRLIWTSNHNGGPRIESIGLDGLGQKVLLDGGTSGEYKGIVVDPVTQRIYWSNRAVGIIESITLDGQQRQTIMANPQFDLYGVAVYGEYLTFTREDEFTSRFWNMGSRKDVTNVINTWVSSSTRDNNRGMYDVALLDATTQPQLPNICQDNYGGCSQLCFQTTSGGQCGCAIGYTLNTDGKTCDSSLVSDQFILYVDPYHKQIYQMQTSTQPSTTQGVPVSKMDFPITMDFDIAGRKVYWVDRDTRQIKSSFLDGTEEKVVYNLPQGSRASKITIDPVGRTIYYIDTSDKSINEININSGKHKLFEKDINNPLALAVDYNSGIVYWTSDDRIERKHIDKKSSKSSLVVNNNVRLTALTIIAGVVYTGDWNTGDIYYMDTNATTLGLVKLTTVGPELYSMAADSMHVYYTKWNEKAVYRINRMDGSNQMLYSTAIFARLTDIKVVETLLPIPAMVVPPPGDNSVIIIAAAAAGGAFFLLLLALLLGLLAARKCKKSSKDSTTEDSSSGFDNVDRDTEYMMYSNGAVFDNRSSNKTAPNMSPKDSLSSDSGVSGMSVHSTSDLIKTNPDIGSSNNSSSNGSVGVDNNAFQGDHPPVANNSNNGNINTGVPVLPAVAPPLSKRYTKKPKSSHKRMKKPQPDSNDFNLREDKKVATVIQRLATRLRKRLSSVRYDEPSPRPGIDTNPSDVNIEIDGVTNPLRLYPEKNKMPPNKRMIEIPSKLHKEPRGWAPASHNVPRTVINTLGRAKGQAVNASMEQA